MHNKLGYLYVLSCIGLPADLLRDLESWKLYIQDAAKKYTPINIFAVFAAIVRNLKAKVYTFM